MFSPLVLASILVQYTPNFGTATAAEKQAVVNAYFACEVERAKSDDDGVSDASTIATAISGSCLPERQRWKDVFSQGADPSVRQAVTDDVDSGVLAFAVRAVLKEREMHRKNSN